MEEGLREREGLDSLIVVESELERSREEAQAMNWGKFVRERERDVGIWD
jgi:hypothetical protein